MCIVRIVTIEFSACALYRICSAMPAPAKCQLFRLVVSAVVPNGKCHESSHSLLAGALKVELSGMQHAPELSLHTVLKLRG